MNGYLIVYFLSFLIFSSCKKFLLVFLVFQCNLYLKCKSLHSRCTVDQPNVNDCLNRDEINRATAVIVRVVQIDSFFDLYKELMRYR